MIAIGALLAGAILVPGAFQAWGDAPFDLARSQGRPVLLLVGDLACEGCPEALALADVSLAAVVGERFVLVAADPLERPEVSDLYRTAASLLPEATPLPPGPVVFLLTADRRPFAAAPLASPGLAGFLEHRALDFVNDPAALEATAGTVVASLRASQAGEAARGPLTDAVPARALGGLLDAMDPVRGGYRAAPKSPPHGALRLLLEETRRGMGGAGATSLLKATLDGMARGAIHDKGAGFFAEAAGEDWSSPLRTKRLADQALLLRAYALAHEATGDVAYREVADEIADFCTRELREQDGSFDAALVAGGPSGFRRDERVVAGWNGLMISGLALSGRKADLAAAARAATAVSQRLGPAPLLRRLGRGEELGPAAFLEDYAFLAEGFLDLAEAGGEPRFVDEASALASAAVSRFLDPDHGGFFDTDERHGTLPARIRNGYDGALPSANGVMASALLKLARATGEKRHAAMARKTVEAFLGDLQRAPRGLETLAAAAGEVLGTRGVPDPVEASFEPRVVRGPVTVEVSLSAARLRPGATLEARVALTVAPGFTVIPRSAGKDLVGLSVSAPGEDFIASPPRYPEPSESRPGEGMAPAYVGTVTVTVPLRARPGRIPGQARVRLRVSFQACDASGCRTPESVMVEIPVTVLPPGR